MVLKNPLCTFTDVRKRMSQAGVEMTSQSRPEEGISGTLCVRKIIPGTPEPQCHKIGSGHLADKLEEPMKDLI